MIVSERHFATTAVVMGVASRFERTATRPPGVNFVRGQVETPAAAQHRVQASAVAGLEVLDLQAQQADAARLQFRIGAGCLQALALGDFGGRSSCRSSRWCARNCRRSMTFSVAAGLLVRFRCAFLAGQGISVLATAKLRRGGATMRCRRGLGSRIRLPALIAIEPTSACPRRLSPALVYFHDDLVCPICFLLLLSLTYLPAQVVHVANLSDSSFDGWKRCTVDVIPAHAAGHVTNANGSCDYVLGRRVGEDTRIVDLRLHLDPWQVAEFDLSAASPWNFVRGPLPNDPGRRLAR